MSNVSKVQLKDLAVEMYQGINTVADKVQYYDEGVKILQAKHITKGYIDFSDARNISREDYNKYKEKYQPRINDILMSNIGTIGKSILVEEEQQYVIAWNIFMIRLKESVYARYINYYFQRLEKINYYEKFMTGNATKFINKTTMAEIEFLLPPLKEQQKIAEILSSVDAAIEKTEQVIAKTEEIKKGLMQQLLTKGIGHTEFKQTELGEIPVEWEIKNLVEVAVLTMGQSPSSEDCNEDGQGLVFFQGCSEFGDKYPIPKKYCTNPRKRASKGDILISVRAPVGDLNIAHIECAIGRGLAAIDPINIDRDYLFYYFKLYKDQWQRIQQGSTFSAINKNDLESVLVPCPPKDEQMLIVSKLLTLDKKLEIETEQLDSLQILKKGLMQQLLTGQVRVKVD